MSKQKTKCQAWGAPTKLVLDNGNSNCYANLPSELLVKCNQGKPYRPVDKAKVERFHALIKPTLKDLQRGKNRISSANEVVARGPLMGVHGQGLTLPKKRARYAMRKEVFERLLAKHNTAPIAWHYFMDSVTCLVVQRIVYVLPVKRNERKPLGNLLTEARKRAALNLTLLGELWRVEA